MQSCTNGKHTLLEVAVCGTASYSNVSLQNGVGVGVAEGKAVMLRTAVALALSLTLGPTLVGVGVGNTVPMELVAANPHNRLEVNVGGASSTSPTVQLVI